MSDDLHLRAGLPPEFGYLEAAYPRQDWPRLGLSATAAHWLEIHAWFRGQLKALTDLGGQWREGRADAPAYRAAAAPRLRLVLNNLHGHHGIESQHYFPALATLEPGMAKGFDLLDRDHDAIEHLLQAMAQAGMALNKALAEGGDAAPAADALADEVARAETLLGRHLWDEEEIVIPVLTLRGDPLAD